MKHWPHVAENCYCRPCATPVQAASVTVTFLFCLTESGANDLHPLVLLWKKPGGRKEATTYWCIVACSFQGELSAVREMSVWSPVPLSFKISNNSWVQICLTKEFKNPRDTFLCILSGTFCSLCLTDSTLDFQESTNKTTDLGMSDIFLFFKITSWCIWLLITEMGAGKS